MNAFHMGGLSQGGSLQVLREIVDERADLGGRARAAGKHDVDIDGRQPVAAQQRDNKLTFPILSDAGSELANAFGIRFALPDYLVEIYGSFGNNLPVVNDDPSWVLPMPARYVIGSDGVIVYAEVNPDYTRRPDASELLPVLDRPRASEAA